MNYLAYETKFGKIKRYDGQLVDDRFEAWDGKVFVLNGRTVYLIGTYNKWDQVGYPMKWSLCESYMKFDDKIQVGTQIILR